MADNYNAGDIVNKSLVAKVKVPVYRSANDSAVPFGYVQPGNSVGVVYSYLAANPNYNRSILWWQFIDGTGQYYYAPQVGGYYDVSALRDQGVITEKEKTDAEKEKELKENSTWYENLLREYWKPVAVVVLAGAAIKGYFSRPSNN